MIGGQTLATTLDNVAAWVESTIAPKLVYLVPPDDGAVDEIEVVLDHPSVFMLFVSSVERLMDGEHQAPSIAVRFLNGLDAKQSTRKIKLELLLTIWAPGHFYPPKPEGETEEPEGEEPAQPPVFVRSADGWRDLFNGLGIIADAIETAETIAGCAIDMNTGVEYGLYEIDGEIPDMFPYWIGKVDFTLIRAPQANKRFQDML